MQFFFSLDIPDLSRIILKEHFNCFVLLVVG